MRLDSDRNMNPLRDRNAEQVVLMTDNRNHFGNQNQNRFYLNDAEGYTHPQKPINFTNTMLPREDRNTNVNIRTNVMPTSQTVLMTENQNNNNNSGLHHQNSVGGYINNNVICSQQHVGLNNFLSHESDIRLCNNRNTNLSHENIEDNIQNDCSIIKIELMIFNKPISTIFRNAKFLIKKREQIIIRRLILILIINMTLLVALIQLIHSNKLISFL